MTAADFRNMAVRMRDAGASTDEWLLELRKAGATQIESVKVVRDVGDVPLGEAKEIVDRSPVWDDRRDVNRRLREDLIRALDEDGGT